MDVMITLDYIFIFLRSEGFQEKVMCDSVPYGAHLLHHKQVELVRVGFWFSLSLLYEITTHYSEAVPAS